MWSNGSYIHDSLIKRAIIQGHSHQIWSDQVGSARTRMLHLRGAWGHAPPGKILKFRSYKIASEINFGSIRCFSEAKRQSFA